MSGNIRNNYTFNRYDLRLSGHKYYDLYLSEDHISLEPVTHILTGDSLVAYIDFNNISTYSTGDTSANTIYSITSWTGGVNSGDTLYDIGLTGTDNGLIGYNSITAITDSILYLNTGDTRLTLNSVTGSTGIYEYPITIESGTTGNYAQLCGGFYQGFYKLDGFDYQTLPNRYGNGWVCEMWVNKNELCSGCTGTTLNTTYPDNKGFFLYLGTRAENKFWNTFSGNTSPKEIYGEISGATFTGTVASDIFTGSISGNTFTGSTTGSTFYGILDSVSFSGYSDDITFSGVIDNNIFSGITNTDNVIREINHTSSTGFPLSPSSYHVDEITNQFMIYSRACSGYTVCNFEQGSTLSITGTTETNPNMDNLFLIMDRSCSGKTACDDVGRNIDLSGTNKNQNLDVYDNSIGFRIKDDGSIGYRRVSSKNICSGDTTVTEPFIEESYSLSGMVENDVWTHIAIRFLYDGELEGCDLDTKPPRLGKLMFYVNSKLKHVVKDIYEVIPRRLYEDKTKQEGVPFNISIGGGTQGLIESVTLDGRDIDDLGLLIEKNFAGTFIGGISKFRMYNDKLCYCTIQDNYNIEKNLYI